MLRTQALCMVVLTQFTAEPTAKMNSSKANFVTWTFCLPPKRQLSILLNFFFLFIDIWYIFSSSKLHFCRTESFCKTSWAFKKSLLFKATVVMRFPANKNTGCPKAPRDTPPRKDVTPPALRWVVLGLPSPPLPQSLYGRAGARTLTSPPKYLPNLLSNGAPLLIPNRTVWVHVRHSGISGEFGRAMVCILRRPRRAKIPTKLLYLLCL